MKVSEMVPLTAAEFRALLDGTDASIGEIARAAGVHARTVKRWRDGEAEIPFYVGALVAMMAVPLALQRADAWYHARHRHPRQVASVGRSVAG